MASSAANRDRVRVKMCSNPSRRVRIVGKIRGLTHQESECLGQETKPWITVCKSQEGASSDTRVIVSLLDQSASRKDASYELDYCYEQDEHASVLFSREIKPLIADVLNGGNASIISYGARGSGKTFVIQGTENKPGLAVMTMDELLSKAEELGKLVSVSIYEVSQEHAYDLLDPKHSEVQVLEDAYGKIHLKGLSQVSVKSFSDFQNMYFSKPYNGKPVQKIPVEQPKRSHKVLTMYLVSTDDNSSIKIVGKMNFVDLAGYEDTRRMSRDGTTLTESTRINRSLHAVANVVYALNANESHVPYRESKLTRMLQESFGGTNCVLMLTCLNPLFCKDTIRVLGLVSRSHQSANHVSTDSIKKAIRSSVNIQVLSAQKNVKPSTTPKAVKNQVEHGANLSAKKASCMSKGRKLCDGGKKVTSNQTTSPNTNGLVKMSELLPEMAKAATPSHLTEMQQSEDDRVLDSPLALVPKGPVLDDKPSTNYSLAAGLPEHEISTDKGISDLEVTPAISCDKSIPEQDGDEGKENKCLQANKGGSPPLSERLRQISNNLKLFCSSTPLRINMPEEVDKQQSSQFDSGRIIEPKTPTIENHSNVLENMKYSSPWETFSKRSSGMKNSLVHEYLKFLNTASKEELKGLRGIGEKRAAYILKLREESLEPFKSLEDLEDIGLSAKQIKGMMKKVAGELFS